MFWGTRAWPGSRQEAEREGDLFPFWHLWLLEKHSLRLFVASEARGDSGPVRPGQLGSEASACVGSVWKLGKGIRGRPQCTSQVSSKGHFRASQGDTLLRQARRTPVSSCPPDCKGGLPTSSPLPWGGGPRPLKAPISLRVCGCSRSVGSHSGCSSPFPFCLGSFRAL